MGRKHLGEALDDKWWREQMSRGRFMRSRIDILRQHRLTMRMRDELPVDAVFRRFHAYASRALDPSRTQRPSFSRCVTTRTSSPSAHLYRETVAARFYHG